ncbi:MAG: ATP-binding protein [Anaerovoracaceae bacterium]|jgi:signal transduction histidine kinase
MNRTTVKIISIISIFSLLVAFLFCAVATIRSSKYLTSEIEKKIAATAEKRAGDLDSQFNHMIGLTDSTASFVASTFDTVAFNQNREKYIATYKKELSRIVRTTLDTSTSVHSLYVTFNPRVTVTNQEVWYVMQGGKATAVFADLSNRRFSAARKDMQYFYLPQKTKGGVWVGPYIDPDLHKELFSYSRAIYVNGQFVGVAGADITAADSINVVRRMRLSKDGISVLLDKQLNPVVHSSGISSKALRSKKLVSRLKANEDKQSGILRYKRDGQKQICGYAKLENGWQILLIQPEATVFLPIDSLKNAMLILGAILMASLIIFLILFSRPFLRRQRTLEEENREKDILLIYQSRKAETGEMMANITHQWKQPLNSINLVLANLLDSYQYGDLDEERMKKSVAKVEHIIANMSSTISDLSGFMKPDKAKTAFDPMENVRTALSLMEESISLHQITVQEEADEKVSCLGYANELTHVIFNLLNNARDAIVASKPQDRRIRIRIARIEKEGCVDISIYNSGIPIAAETAEHIFEPYFTTHEEYGGTGLGLYICKKIVEERMDGRLTFANVEGGVQFTIRLPQADDQRGEN